MARVVTRYCITVAFLTPSFPSQKPRSNDICSHVIRFVLVLPWQKLNQEPLDSQSASRLAGAFSTMHLRQGETVAVEGSPVERCFLIEYGSVEVLFLG